MDAASTAQLGNKVIQPTMLRDYDIWSNGETFNGGTPMGINAWGQPEEYPAFVMTNEGWAGGAIVSTLSEFETAPDLSPLMDGDYYFHFAVKSPSSQAHAAWKFIFYSEGAEANFEFGTGTANDYVHNGEWQHFEIPISELINQGYLWTGPLTVEGLPTAGGDRKYILGFLAPAHDELPCIEGTEFNIDALFFYKKQAQ